MPTDSKRSARGRVHLERLKQEEITDDYVAWHNNVQHTKYYSSTGKTFSRESLRAEMAEGLASNTLVVYGVYYTENGKLIGNVKIGPISVRHKTSDLVVFIGDTSYLRQGLGVEAIEAGNRLAFEELGIRKLHSGMYRGNIGSVKAYIAAGWVIEGVLTGHYLVDGTPEDRILVACFNPRYFDVSGHDTRFPSVDDVYST